MVEPYVVYKTNQLLPVATKDVLPALQNSNVIYQFSCHCDSRYVGRTSQRLQDRIKQRVSKSIRYGTSSLKRDLPIRKCKYSTKSTTQIQSLTHDSAIGLHLLRNPTCAQHNDDSMFSILAKGRSPFHLSALEATFIKTSNPILCRQKEFVYSLKIMHVTAELWTYCVQLRCHAHWLSANHSSARSINIRPFLCSPFWRSFLISVRQKASKEMNTLLKAILLYNIYTYDLPVTERVRNTFNLVCLVLLQRNSGVFTATKILLFFLKINQTNQ